MKQVNKKYNIWPVAIIAYFVVFIFTMAAWVSYAIRQNMDLVRKDYYDQEILFQQQIDRVKRTAAIRKDVAIGYDIGAQTLTVKVPLAGDPQAITGSVRLYRPSDASLDKTLPLALKPDGVQTIAAGELQAGLWKVQVNWVAGESEYYFEQPVILAGGKN